MPISPGLKQSLLLKCIALKEESESNILAAMEDAQSAANEYGAPRDRYDSFRAQLMRKRDMLAQQLAVVEEELRHLRQIPKDKVCDRVEPGALVALDQQILFVIAGIGKMETDGITVYAVSPVVPLIQAMQGLKAGDSFNFRGTAMKIREIC
jgi:hypothetical protein